ncbi:hypothetical protein SteCoe_32050 [Stentor coeruleus]|uniref:Uncharacterized protein n=1 Tax=Stentor coeruleus TaxID=5963 RepID=A0A1R2B030_9CILI|nr:hypothetical protein SteCoe_32050 [Stentor coeruleus]
MHSSKSIRIRKYIVSPEFARPVNMCLTSREISTGLRLELESKPKIVCDPFKNFQIGKKSRLKPVVLKTNKKCIINDPKNAVSMKCSESSRLEDYVKPTNKTYLSVLNYEKCEQKGNLKKVYSLGEFGGLFGKKNVARFEPPHFPHTTIHKKKRVTFSEKNLETFFEDYDEKLRINTNP